jgi:hypothetical protein
VTDPAYHLQSGLEIHKMIYVPPSEKKRRKVLPRKNVKFAQHVNEEMKPVLYVHSTLWHFAKLCFW